jgi:glycosyltransferase involved in cell wall biosynthesis
MVSICLNAKEFDLVHTQILPVPVLDCLLLAWISRRVPAVCTVHELVPHGSKFRRLTGFALRAIYKVADLLFVYTEYTRRRLVEDGIKPEKIRVVPHGALEHLLRIQTPSRPASKQAPVALFIGNIRADKGVDVLVAAATYLRAMVANFKIVIAGTPGFDMTDLQRFATRNGLHECLEFRLGYLSDSEFVAYLRNADVVVLPYRRIEQSGVAVAACTFAKAIVATQCGGVAELVAEAANGLLVPVDDPSALAKAVAEILLSPEKRDHFERQSQRYATQVLGWQAITSKTLAGYRLALGQIEQSDNEALLEQACK